MADSKSSPSEGSGDPVDRILYGDPALKSVEQAIYKALQTFAESTASEVKKIIETNSPSAEARKEMEELQKAVIKMTRETIENGPLSALKGKNRGG